MRPLRPLFLLIIFAGSGPAASRAQSGSATSIAMNSPTHLSERVVAYEIEARFDAHKKTIDGSETLTYRNLTGKPQDTFPFHLYQNAFQPKSTFMQEERRDRRNFKWEEKYRASADVKSLEVTGMGDLTSKIRFISPDDG